MTEKEAIEVLTAEKQCLERASKGACKIDCGECKHSVMITKQIDSLDVAIKALEEIQQYREIGTVEELTMGKRCISLVKKHGTIGEMIDECVAYEETGTVEECREAREKQKAKKPIIGADFMVGSDDNGEPIWEHDYACPECGLGIAGEYICCPYCGTYIDWSEEE